MTVTKPEKSGQKIVYRDKYNHVYTQTVDFGAFTKEYFVTYCGPRVGLLVVNGDSILLVRQYRLLVDGLSWEVPGGEVNKTETPEASARRECLEETGFDCRNLKPLMHCQETLEAIESPIHLFYTRDFEEKEPFQPDPKEVEAIQWVPLKECMDMIQKGTINDSFTILALLTYKVFITDSQKGLK